MKKLIELLVVTMIAGATFADDGWIITGSASSVMVAPEQRPNASNIALWTAKTYAAGDYVKLANGAIYWTPTGGASTTEPSHGAKDGTTSYDSDAIWWKRIDNAPRKALIIYADSTTTAYCSAGNEVRMSGGVLDALNPAIQFNSDEQRAVYVKGTGTFHVHERK